MSPIHVLELLVLFIGSLSGIANSQYVDPGFWYAKPEESSLSFTNRSSLGCPSIYPGNGSFCCQNGPYMFNRSDISNDFVQLIGSFFDTFESSNLSSSASVRNAFVNIASNNTYLEFTWLQSSSEWRNQFGIFVISPEEKVEKNSLFDIFKDMTGVSTSNPFCHVLGDTVRVGPFSLGQRIGFYVKEMGAENDMINVQNATLKSTMISCLSAFNFSTPDFYKCYRDNGLSSFDPNFAYESSKSSFIHSVRDLNNDKTTRFVAFRVKQDILIGYQVGNLSTLEDISYKSGVVIMRIISPPPASDQGHLLNYCQGSDDRITISYNITSGSCICSTKFTSLTYNSSLDACQCLNSICNCPKTSINSTCICRYEEDSGSCRINGNWTCSDCSSEYTTFSTKSVRETSKTTAQGTFKATRPSTADDFFQNILLVLIGLGGGITFIAIVASLFVAYGRGYRRKMDRIKAKKSQINLLSNSMGAMQRSIPLNTYSNQSSGMSQYPISSQQLPASAGIGHIQNQVIINRSEIAISPSIQQNKPSPNGSSIQPNGPSKQIATQPLSASSPNKNSNIQKDMIKSTTNIKNGVSNNSKNRQPPPIYDSKAKLEEPAPKVFLGMQGEEFKNFSSGGRFFSSTTSNDATVTQNVTSVPLFIPGFLNLKMDVDLVIPDISNKIGKGGTASIFKGVLINESIIARRGGTREVAVKISEGKPNETEDKKKRRIEDLMYEIAIMSSIPTCPNVVQFIGFMDTPMQCIVMKYYSTSLSSMIADPQIRISPDMVVNIGYQIANGMVVIHEKRVLHLDIKPNNVLMEVHPDGSFECVICDFGFASLIGDSQDRVVSGLNVPTTTGITFRYCAPEIFERIAQGELTSGRVHGELDKMIDVYAFSITMYEVMYRKSPWLHMDKKEIASRVREGERPTLPVSGSKEDLQYKGTPQLVRIITSCWAEKPESRMTFLEIKTALSTN